jgi:uridine kinase
MLSKINYNKIIITKKPLAFTSSDPNYYETKLNQQLNKQNKEFKRYKSELTSEFLSDSFKKIVKDDNERAKPVFRKVKESFIKKISQKIALHPEETFSVGIAGQSASGKTSFSNHLMSILNKFGIKNLATMVSCDNYYKECPGIKEAGGFVPYLRKTGETPDQPSAVDLDAFKNDFKQLQKGESLWIPKLDFVSSKVNPKGEFKTSAKCLISEGLFTLTDKVKDLFDIKIFVHRKEETIKRHWYDRAPERGLINKDDQDFLYNLAKKGAEKYVEPTKDNADIVINRNASKEDREQVVNDIYKVIKNAEELLSIDNVA